MVSNSKLEVVSKDPRKPTKLVVPKKWSLLMNSPLPMALPAKVVKAVVVKVVKAAKVAKATVLLHLTTSISPSSVKLLFKKKP